MKLKVYDDIVSTIKTNNHRRECLQALTQHFPRYDEIQCAIIDYNFYVL